LLDEGTEESSNNVYQVTRSVAGKRLIVGQLVKVFPAFYGTRGFIIMLIKTSSGPYPEPYESRTQSYPIPLRSTLILFSQFTCRFIDRILYFVLKSQGVGLSSSVIFFNPVKHF
jgi:hypothetical protein